MKSKFGRRGEDILERTKEMETLTKRDRKFMMRQEREVGRDVNRRSVCISREGQRGAERGEWRSNKDSQCLTLQLHEEDERTQHVRMYVLLI